MTMTMTMIGYEPAEASLVSPKTAKGGFFFLYRYLVFPKKMSSNESLNNTELFRLKDPKTCFSAYSLKPNFNKLNLF